MIYLSDKIRRGISAQQGSHSLQSVKSYVLLFVLCTCVVPAFSQTWIWYPGDFEINLANKVQNRRTERGTFFPVFWKMDAHYVLVDFHKVFDVPVQEEVDIFAEGKYTVKLDGKAFEGSPGRITVPAGRHKINIKVFNQAHVPAVYVKGRTIVSDSSWLVTYEDKEWIDETGKTSDISATRWLNAGSAQLSNPQALPSAFSLPARRQHAVSATKTENGVLYDFGKETFGFITLHALRGSGTLSLYYGESKEEALSTTHCETLDRLQVNNSKAADTTLQLSKAFRYVLATADATVKFDSASMLYEYAPVQQRGSFACSDSNINRIYEVSKYTFELNTREFFIDGIKRDRWVWSGDAYQSYLMNYYLYFDNETVKRTLYALRGKDPVTAHINTIMDYTFYWFLGIYDYYLYTGDKSFIAQNYDRMKSLMDYVLGRRNKNGWMEWMAGDWIFIDWAAGLSKKGEVSFEQLLLVRSLETMALCAGIANDASGGKQYEYLAQSLHSKLFEDFWNPQKQALVHSRINGKQTDDVTRYANMFAIFFNYFDDQQKQAVKQSVLLNNTVQKITTPYMRFYELEALCAMGEQAYVLKEMKDYWGGMLRLGATSFWEEYNPEKQGSEHYAMYGRPFGKSLCHAWGASPLYLLGKYYLGVKPTAPGYTTYEVVPNLGGLQWMQGKVPTPAGEIDLYVSTTQIKIKAPVGMGTLRIKSRKPPVGNNITVTARPDGAYEVAIKPGINYTINYTAW